MDNVTNVVNYFLFKAMDNEGENITNLKLQKLLYYAQGFHLALLGKPLFDDRIEAWRYGPVCPSVYVKFKIHGSSPLPYNSEIDFSELFSNKQMDLLDEIYDVFGQYSAWKLRDMTHEEPTWIDNEATVSEIPQSEMKEYFLTRVK